MAYSDKGLVGACIVKSSADGVRFTIQRAGGTRDLLQLGVAVIGRRCAVWRAMTTAIDNFLTDGFVAVRGAVAPGIVRTCVALIDDELHALGVDPGDPVTWKK